MTISSESALRSNSRKVSASRHSGFACVFRAILAAGCLTLAHTPAGLFAQTPSPSQPPRATTAPATSDISAPAVSTNAVSAPSGYILSPNDQVAVEVFGEDDLRTNGRLSADGNLSLPLLGSVRLGGLTLNQAAARLTELYGRDYLVNPKVNVTLAAYAKRRFTVLGQVNRPGSYEMPEGSPGGVDILEAIAMAGGYTRIAAPERISVRRHGDQFLKVNAKRLARGDGSSFRVESGDTITVGESIF
jgi:polysaccharide export outer membrane protein